MDLLPGEIDDQIIESVSRVLSERSSLSDVRQSMDSSGLRPELWSAAVEQGWFGLAVPEELEGAGFSIVQLVLVFELLGANVAPGPFLASAAGALALAGTDFGKRLLAGQPVALGVDTRGGPGLQLDGHTVTGYIDRVHHGVPGSPMMCDVDGQIWWIEQAEYTSRPCIDPTVQLASANLMASSATPTGVATKVLNNVLDLLAAAMAVGVSAGALALGVDYAKSREQFGHPIGSFQAIKHKLAEVAVRTEAGRSLVIMAALEARDRNDWTMVPQSRLLSASYAVENTSTVILVHGAIGWTAECNAQLYHRRSRYLEQFRTGPDELVQTILDDATHREAAREGR